MDWPKLVEELKQTGLTQAEIAGRADIATGTLSELRTGKVVDPAWSKGNALIELHGKLCKKKRNRR